MRPGPLDDDELPTDDDEVLDDDDERPKDDDERPEDDDKLAAEDDELAVEDNPSEDAPDETVPEEDDDDPPLPPSVTCGPRTHTPDTQRYPRAASQSAASAQGGLKGLQAATSNSAKV